MTQPVEYQTPLPIGRHLRYHELPEGLRVTREFVSQFALWRELLMPVFCVVALVGSGLFAAMTFANRWPMDRHFVWSVRIEILVVEVAFLVWIIRSSWINAGVVTEVAIVSDAVFWRKQNLWGFREYIWPLNAIMEVRYDPRNHSLKIHRSRGTSLNAFAYFPKEELEEAAFRLSVAIDRIRRLPNLQAN